MIKFKNLNGDNSKTRTVTKLKNWSCDKTKKNQNVTKHNWWQNSSCDKTQIVTKLKLWQNSSCEKTQIVTKLKLWKKKSKLKGLRCYVCLLMRTVYRLLLKDFCKYFFANQFLFGSYIFCIFFNNTFLLKKMLWRRPLPQF